MNFRRSTPFRSSITGIKLRKEYQRESDITYHRLPSGILSDNDPSLQPDEKQLGYNRFRFTDLIKQSGLPSFLTVHTMESNLVV